MADHPIPGRVFSRLTVVSFQGTIRRKRRYLCRCECGVEKSVAEPDLVRGTIKSCGCFRRERMAALERTHGEAGSAPTVMYQTWCAMHERIAKSGYRSLGVVVCDEWKTYEPFRDYVLANLGERPPGHSLDRINNNRGYEPGNVRWATATTQQRNTRATRFIVANGERLCLTEWAERLGVDPAVIRERLKDGWPPERAVTAPLFTQRKRRRDAGVPRVKKPI